MTQRGDEWVATYLGRMKESAGSDLLANVAHDDDGEHLDPALIKACEVITEVDVDKLVDEAFVAISTTLTSLLGLHVLDIGSVTVTSSLASFVLRWYALGVARGMGAPPEWLNELGSTEWYQDSIAGVMEQLSGIIIDDDGTVRPSEERRLINPFEEGGDT